MPPSPAIAEGGGGLNDPRRLDAAEEVVLPGADERPPRALKRAVASSVRGRATSTQQSAAATQQEGAASDNRLGKRAHPDHALHRCARIAQSRCIDVLTDRLPSPARSA
jgi:hypothetical protein